MRELKKNRNVFLTVLEAGKSQVRSRGEQKHELSSTPLCKDSSYNHILLIGPYFTLLQIQLHWGGGGGWGFIWFLGEGYILSIIMTFSFWHWLVQVGKYTIIEFGSGHSCLNEHAAYVSPLSLILAFKIHLYQFFFFFFIWRRVYRRGAIN